MNIDVFWFGSKEYSCYHASDEAIYGGLLKSDYTELHIFDVCFVTYQRYMDLEPHARMFNGAFFTEILLIDGNAYSDICVVRILEIRGYHSIGFVSWITIRHMKERFVTK